MTRRSEPRIVRLLRRLPHVDVGRWRAILHVIDMKPWLDETCPTCGLRFTVDPGVTFMATRLHGDCAEAYVNQWYADEEARENADAREAEAWEPA